MSSKDGSDTERLADFITLVRQQPRTIRQIAERLEVGQPAVRAWIRIFSDKGHVVEAVPTKVGKQWLSQWRWKNHV